MSVLSKTKLSVACEQPPECTGKGHSGEKQGDAIKLFVPFVPHAQIEHDPREEPGFRHAQEEASGEESGEVLSEAHKGANGTPDEGESRKPEPRSGEPEDNI